MLIRTQSTDYSKGVAHLERSDRKVSIGISTFNRLDYLKVAVDSAFKQTYMNLEVVVSDNASTDSTWSYLSSLRDCRLRSIRQSENIGMAANFNACLRASTGEFFLLLSDDDVLRPEAVERLLAPFCEQAQEKIGMSWSPCSLINATGRKLWTTARGPSKEGSVRMLRGVFEGRRGPRLAGVMVRRLDAERFGGFNEARHGLLCDTGSWGQIALSYSTVACTREPFVDYRVHAGSLTHGADCAEWRRFGDNMHDDFVEVLRSVGNASGINELSLGMKHHLANITVTVLLRFVGVPGRLPLLLRELWTARSVLLSFIVVRRIVVDGWKLFRIEQPAQGITEVAGSDPVTPVQVSLLEPAMPMQLAPQREGFLSKLASHIPPHQFVRYILVGSFNTLFGYTMFALLNFLLRRHQIPASYLFAAAISNLINITVAFFGYKWFVFKTKGNYLREWLKAMAVYWSGFIPGLILLPVLVRAIVICQNRGLLDFTPLLGFLAAHIPRLAQMMPSAADLPPYLANAVLLMIGVVYSFIGHKKVTFRVITTRTPEDTTRAA